MSSSLNKAMIIGNVTKDVEIKTLESDNSVCSFSVATNRSWKDGSGEKKEQVEFHNVVAWGKLADICAKYLRRGSKCYIEGRLQTRQWETPQGEKRQKTEIVAMNMTMLDKKPQGGVETAAFVPPAPDAEISVSDIPFSQS